MDWREQLFTWLNAFNRWHSLKPYFVVSGDEPGRIHVQLFTATHQYSISATLDYLGAGASMRAPRPGETWTRGNDLADGPFSLETWVRILTDIVGYELRPIELQRVGVDVPEIKTV